MKETGNTDPEAATSLQRARELRLQGHLAAAARIVDQLIQRDPEQAPVLVEAAVIRRQQGDNEGAHLLLQKAAALAPAAFDVRIWTAYVLLSLGRLDQARHTIEALARDFPGHAGVDMALGSLERYCGNHAAAAAALSRVLRHDPSSVPAVLGCADSCIELGRLDEAVRLLRPPLAAPAAAAQRRVLLGRIAERAGDDREALELYAGAHGLDPTSLDPLLRAADVHRRRGDVPALAATLASAFALAPASERVLLNIAELLVMVRRPAEAIALLARVAARGPGNREAAMRLSQLHAQEGSADIGLAALEERAYSAPSDIGIAHTQAALHAAEGRYERALEVLGRHDPERPDSPLRLDAARYAFEGGEVERAEALLAAGPFARTYEVASFHLLRAAIAGHRGKPEAAMAEVEAALAAEPRNVHAHRTAAKLAIRQLDVDRLGRHVDAALRLSGGAEAVAGGSINKWREFTGVILNELSIEPGIVDAVVAARALAAEDRAARLAALVVQHPHHLAPALALLEDVLARRAPEPSPGGIDKPPVPRLITQFWPDTRLPRDIRRYVAGWQATAGFTHRLLDAARAHDIIRRELGREQARAFVNARQPAQRADYVRLCALYLDGGLSVDADSVCRRDPALLAEQTAGLLLYREWMGSLGADVVVAAPRHPVLEAALDQATQSLLAAEADGSWLALGPGLITRAVAGYVARRTGGRALPADMTVLSQPAMAHCVALQRPAAHKGAGSHGDARAAPDHLPDLSWIAPLCSEPAEALAAAG